MLYEDPQEELLSLEPESQEESKPRSSVASTEFLSGGEQAARAWSLLDSEIRDISLLMVQFSPRKPVTIKVERQHGTGSSLQAEAAKSTSKVYPMAGAVLGTCLGGPVGVLAGIKIGGLAAIGGSIFGGKIHLLLEIIVTQATQREA